MTDAYQKLSRMVAADSEPKLAPADLEMLLASAARADADGRLPSAPEWIPTYDLNRAAAEGWRWKAAKASELVSVDLDGERLSSNQIFEHCERMARMYSRKGRASFNTGKK
jgi:hypothetical protein